MKPVPEPIYRDPLYLTRLSWLAARAAAMLRHESNLATIDAAVKMAEARA